MEIKILVKEHQESDLHNFIDSCIKHGFSLTRQCGGKMPNFSGYYAELKGECWGNTDTGDRQLTIPDVSNSVCSCGNKLTEKEIFYETCLVCMATVEQTDC